MIPRGISPSAVTRSAANRYNPRDVCRNAIPTRLSDAFGRRVDYLRLAVTDRCNLRCRYCMPAEGIASDDRVDILTWSELVKLARIACDLGVRKVRITGGEPLVRPGVIDFLAELNRLPRRPELLLTTNGTNLMANLDDLADVGIERLNVSLDSLDPQRYRDITRRGRLDDVLAALAAAETAGFALKLNVVVIPGVNDCEIPAFVALTRVHPWTVRFIEPMPFCGRSRSGALGTARVETAIGIELFAADQIVRRLAAAYELERLPAAVAAVDRLYRVRGHAGKIGVIAGHSRTFCTDCSRLRISADGQLRTCLYARPALDLKALLRDGASDTEIAAAITAAVRGRHADGFAAEQERGGQKSMAQIGG